MKACEEITQHPRFQKVVSTVIIICAIVLGVETILVDPKYMLFLEIVDVSITIFFIVEIIVRILSYQSPITFFVLLKRDRLSDNKSNWQFVESGFWNWFDFLITLGSTIALLEHLFIHPEYFFVTRLFRIFRILRLLEVNEKMRDLERMIAKVVPTVFSFLLLIFVILYIYSIIGFYLFRGASMGAADFSNLSESVVTMFQVMTLDGWGEILNAAEEGAPHLSHWVFVVFFISFIGITAIITLNIFIAVLSTSAQKEHMEDDYLNNARQIQLLVNEFQAVRKDLFDIKKEIQSKTFDNLPENSPQITLLRNAQQTSLGDERTNEKGDLSDKL